MQITGMFIFLFVWLLILWLGSIALEATGMERPKARFQALSALSGTGFTTRDSESIVSHPKRRRIVSWLIFLGSVGITAFIFLMILYVRAGIAAPTLIHIGIILFSIFIFVLLIWTGIINKLTSIFVRWLHKAPVYIPEEILHQMGDYGIARFRMSEIDGAAGLTIGTTKFKERNITILAIERGDKVLSLPKDEEPVMAGDYLLCYGKVSEFNGF
jgi:amino acid transporter